MRLYKETGAFLEHNFILLDSALVNGGKFVFKGAIDNPVMALVTFNVKGQINRGTKFILEPGDICLDVESFSIGYGGTASGTAINDDYKELVSGDDFEINKASTFFMHKRQELFMKKGKDYSSLLYEKDEDIEEEMEAIKRDYWNSNPSKPRTITPREAKLVFVEKWIIYPDVVEPILASYMTTPDSVKVIHLLEQLPEERRSSLRKAKADMSERMDELAQDTLSMRKAMVEMMNALYN